MGLQFCFPAPTFFNLNQKDGFIVVREELQGSFEWGAVLWFWDGGTTLFALVIDRQPSVCVWAKPQEMLDSWRAWGVKSQNKQLVIQADSKELDPELASFMWLAVYLCVFVSMYLLREEGFRFTTSTVGTTRKLRGFCWSSIRSGQYARFCW